MPPRQHDPIPYPDSVPLMARFERSRAIEKRSLRRHAAFAIAISAALVAYGALDLLDPPGSRHRADLAWSLLFAALAAHVFLLLPAMACWRAVVAMSETARGIAGAMPSDLLALPDQPRPLSFHARRAALLPVARWRAGHAFVVACVYFAPLGAAFFLAALVWASWGLGEIASFIGACFLLPAFLACFVAGISFAIGAPFLSAMVGFASGLGELSRYATSEALGKRERAEIAERLDLDERWGADRGEGTGQYVRAALLRCAALGSALAAIGVGQAVVVALVTDYGERLLAEPGTLRSTLLFVVALMAGQIAYAVGAARWVGWLGRRFPKAIAA